MKNILLTGLVLLLLTSCQKDWTCECEKHVNDRDTFSFELRPVHNALRFKAKNKCKDMQKTHYVDGNKVEYMNCVIENVK